MKKNSELTYKEMYQQPASFQAVNDTLEDILQDVELLFNWHRLQQQHFPLIQEFRQREFHALSCIIFRKLM